MTLHIEHIEFHNHYHSFQIMAQLKDGIGSKAFNIRLILYFIFG